MSEIGRKVVELRASGLRTIEIAHRLDVAQSTVHYHLRRLADPPPARRKPPRQLVASARSTVGTRGRVAELLAQGVSRTETARRLGLSKSTVSYHARRLGEAIDERFGRRYDWRAIQAFYDAGHSLRDCQREFGFANASWCEAVQRGLIVPRPRYKPVEEVFARDTHRNRGHLKTKLLRAGLKENRGERCGLSDWLGAPLTVSLHHINGDRLDNRVENLQLLCPNCHAQTDTFGGRNGDRRALPTATSSHQRENL